MEHIDKGPLLYSVDAILWVGEHRIAGLLTVTKDALEFLLKPDPKSHFSLLIRKKDIRQVEEFLLFGVSRNGLSVISKNGKTDSFIVDDPGSLKLFLLDWLR